MQLDRYSSKQQQAVVGGGTHAQLGQTSKTRQKINQKIREIDGAYLCLERFGKFECNDRKRKACESIETLLTKFVKSVQVNLFSALFLAI